MNLRKAAFTLIELLVVIFIIGLLASIALPAFRSAEEKAHGTQDANNLRQIGIGMTAYLGDHDDTMFSGSSALTGGTTWAISLGPTNWGSTTNYVANTASFQSPFDGRPTSTGSNVSYGMNSLITSASNSNVSSWHYPSALILIAPNGTLSGGNLSYAGTPTGGIALTSGSVVGEIGAHTLTYVLYVDTHVSSVQASTINSAGATSQTWLPQ